MPPAAHLWANAAGYSYGLTGSAVIAAPRATLPLTGSLTVTAELAFRVGVVLNRAAIRTTMLGFLPVAITMLFVPDSLQAGELGDTGFTVHIRFSLAVPQATLLGIPVTAGGCRAATPIPVTLRSGASFTLADGGPVTGGFRIPAVIGCGRTGDQVSSMLRGDGNSLTLMLVPARRDPGHPRRI